MPALKRRDTSPQPSHTPLEVRLGLATSADFSVGSEVGRLHDLVEAEFERDRLRPWPLAISVPVTIAVTSGLWWGIIAGARALLRL